MGVMHLRRYTSLRKRLRIFALSGLLLCIFLLSACGTTTPQKTTSALKNSISTPVIDPSIQNTGDMQLQVFQQWISLMQHYKGDVTSYQQQYTSDQQALHAATTMAAYTTALNTLNTHVTAIQIPAMKAESNSLFQELQQDATSFGKQHTFYDSYDNKTYPRGYEYGSTNGATSSLWLKGELSTAKTLADYQQAVEDLNMNLSNFHAMVADFSDPTPYNQVHKSDMQLLQLNNYMKSNTVVVSLAEQTLRAYTNGKLVKAFQVTTGQPDLPTPPGTWWVEGKKSPTEFKADVPQSSPDWYPPTLINFAMQFHSNGYFLHDSWWRTEYGPGTNFPHLDAGGSQFSLHDSHGCVNMSTDNAKWLYSFVKVYTNVLIY
jgi:hypothetical protein